MRNPSVLDGKRRHFVSVLLAVAAAVTGVSCRSTPAPAPFKPYYAVDIPFIEQSGSDDCGPTALAMLIRHSDGKPDLETLREALMLPALGGTIPALIVAVAAEKGYHADVWTDNATVLESALKDGIPLIVLLGPTEPPGPGHYVVVTAITETGDGIRMHDGPKRDRWMDREMFYSRWEKTGYLAITITAFEDLQ